jgi:hypothetical protein
LHENKQLSYVQTRGSIPVYWAQIINLKYTPKLWIGETRKSVSRSVIWMYKILTCISWLLLVCTLMSRFVSMDHKSWST